MVSKAGDPFSHAISATFIQYHNSAEVSIRKSENTSMYLLHVDISSALESVL